MPRFVILRHDHPQLHWDFMLEDDGALRTWRLLSEPIANIPIRAEPSFLHRLAYLDYEGPVSGDRGSVTRQIEGTYDGTITSMDDVRIVIQSNLGNGTITIKRNQTKNLEFYWEVSD